MARLHANENLPAPVVEELRRLGHDILSTQETGQAGQATPDEEVLAFATDERRILLTFNRTHYVYLHEQNPVHEGIIVCTFDPDFESLANRIHAALESNPILTGQLIPLNRPQE